MNVVLHTQAWADRCFTPHGLPAPAQSVLESKVIINVCPEERACASDAGQDGLLQMNLTSPITDADAKAIFSPLSGIKVLEFTRMLGVFSGFAQEADKERFHRRVKDYAGIWCCIHAHPVRARVTFVRVLLASLTGFPRAAPRQGHIWYDLLFDMPHTDRHNRHFDGSFPLLTGP